MLVSNVGVKQYIASLKTGQKIKKSPGFVKKPGENLPKYPVTDTISRLGVGFVLPLQ